MKNKTLRILLCASLFQAVLCQADTEPTAPVCDMTGIWFDTGGMCVVSESTGVAFTQTGEGITGDAHLPNFDVHYEGQLSGTDFKMKTYSKDKLTQKSELRCEGSGNITKDCLHVIGSWTRDQGEVLKDPKPLRLHRTSGKIHFISPKENEVFSITKEPAMPDVK